MIDLNDGFNHSKYNSYFNDIPYYNNLTLQSDVGFSNSITQQFADIHQIVRKLRSIIHQRVDIVNKEQNIILEKMQYISPECSNQMRILFEKEDKLRQIKKVKYNKENELDQRELSSKQILAEQIDNIAQEENFVESIEQNVQLMLQENLDCENVNSDSRNENLLKEIIQIEDDNKKRKVFLNSYKQNVENLKMTVQQLNHQNSDTKNIPKYNISVHKDTKQVSQQVKIDIEKQFNDRKMKLESLQREILQLEEQTNQNRVIQERNFNQKLAKMEELSKRLMNSKTDTSFIKSENNQLKIKLASLIQEKAAIIRKITNVDRDKNAFNYKNDSLEKKLKSLAKKKKNIKIRQNELNNRSRQIKKFRVLIQAKEDELKQYEQKILNLEKEVIDLENQNTFVLDQIKIAHSANVSIIKSKQLRNIIVEQTDNDDVFKLSQLE